MTEKRFTCETKTQGSVSIDLMKDNGQIIEKFEAINLLNELNDKNELLAHNSEEYRKLSIHFEQRNNELISNNTFLEKENEQLKKENYQLHKRLGDFEPFGRYMKERTSKTSVNDIIGLVKTDEPTNSVELKKELYK